MVNDRYQYTLQRNATVTVTEPNELDDGAGAAFPASLPWV